MRRFALAGMLAGSLVLLASAPALGASYGAEASEVCKLANSQAARAFAEYEADKAGKKGEKRDKLRIRLSRTELEIGAAELARLEAIPQPPGMEQFISPWLEARRDIQRVDERDHKLFKRSLNLDRVPKNFKRLRRLLRQQDEISLKRRNYLRTYNELGQILGATECVGAGTGAIS